MNGRTRFWRNSTVAVAGTMTGAGLCLVFLVLLHAQLPRLQGFDLGVQAWVHGWRNVHVTRVMMALTRIGSIAEFSIALGTVLMGLWLRGSRHAVALLSFAVGVALVLNESFKLAFHRARPLVPWSIGDEHTYSFPSGHSLFSVVLYGTLCYLALRHGVRSWRVVPVAVLLPAGIGISRIYLGEHWPTDVLAGWGCGLIWLAAVVWVDLHVSPRVNLQQVVVSEI